MNDNFFKKTECDEECIKFSNDLNDYLESDGYSTGERSNAFDNQCSDCKRFFCGYHVSSRQLQSWEEDILGSREFCGNWRLSAERCSQCMYKPGNFFEKKDLKSRWNKFIDPLAFRIRMFKMKIRNSFKGNKITIEAVNFEDIDS